jgi:hypothetical protein
MMWENKTCGNAMEKWPKHSLPSLVAQNRMPPLGTAAKALKEVKPKLHNKRYSSGPEAEQPVAAN